MVTARSVETEMHIASSTDMCSAGGCFSISIWQKTWNIEGNSKYNAENKSISNWQSQRGH